MSYPNPDPLIPPLSLSLSLPPTLTLFPNPTLDLTLSLNPTPRRSPYPYTLSPPLTLSLSPNQVTRELIKALEAPSPSTRYYVTKVRLSPSPSPP